MVLFDSLSWETHLLPPSSAVIAEIALELSQDDIPVRIEVLKKVLDDDYEQDPNAPSMIDFLRTLSEIGLIAE
jgi:PqqD family protein of HPr-rel-A system